MMGSRSMLGRKRKRPRRAPNSIPWKTLARAVGGPRNYELKFHDESLFSHALTNDLTAAAALAELAANGQLCGIVQGSASNQRIGRCAYIKSVYIDGHITLPAASAAENNGYVTLWLVEDKQTNGAQMSVANFLSNPTGTTTDADALQNLHYSDRFKLLAKRKILFPPRNTYGDGTTNDVGAQDIPFNIYKRINIKKEHSGTGAVIADVTTSSLHLIAIRSASAHASTTISYNARIRYTD